MCYVCDQKNKNDVIWKVQSSLERVAMTATVQCLVWMLHGDVEKVRKYARESAHQAKGVLHFRETLRRREPPTYIIIDLNNQIKINR